MPNRGNLNWSSSNTTYSVPAGYYSGGTLDSRPSYNAGYNAGKSATTITVKDVSANCSNFGDYNEWGVERSPKFSIPSTPSGKSLKYVYIKSIYVSNSNQRFGSGTFQTLKSGSAYYIISKGATWPEGGTTVNGTLSFVFL